jgi:hypothetical protein
MGVFKACSARWFVAGILGLPLAKRRLIPGNNSHAQYQCLSDILGQVFLGHV